MEAKNAKNFSVAVDNFEKASTMAPPAGLWPRKRSALKRRRSWRYDKTFSGL